MDGMEPARRIRDMELKSWAYGSGLISCIRQQEK